MKTGGFSYTVRTTAGPAAVPASVDNWGLSFPNPGQSPVGNATAESLAQYDAHYLGDTSKKVIYLTFDCGYENGCTEKILDALQKHQAPAAFFVVGHMVESPGHRASDGGGGAHCGQPHLPPPGHVRYRRPSRL